MIVVPTSTPAMNRRAEQQLSLDLLSELVTHYQNTILNNIQNIVLKSGNLRIIKDMALISLLAVVKLSNAKLNESPAFFMNTKTMMQCHNIIYLLKDIIK
jgi:hypothetical protein